MTVKSSTLTWTTEKTKDELIQFIIKNQNKSIAELCARLSMPSDIFLWFYKEYVMPVIRDS